MLLFRLPQFVPFAMLDVWPDSSLSTIWNSLIVRSAKLECSNLSAECEKVVVTLLKTGEMWLRCCKVVSSGHEILMRTRTCINVVCWKCHL
jgi:hypothetical protein